MRVDKKLNLIMSVDCQAGRAWVHSTPLGREAFEDNVSVLSRTFSTIYGKGLTVFSGPRVAAMLLKKVAKEDGEWDTANGRVGVADGLMAEIRRLTNVVVAKPGGAGWVTVPFQKALDDGLFDEDDVSEVENAVVFFMLASAMLRRGDLLGMMAGASRLWDTDTTSLNVTEYRASLPTSTATGTSEESGPAAPAQASSVPT